MKTNAKIIGLFVLFCIFFAVPLGAQTDPRPRSPQPMSNKTAMEYFRDEGLSIGINFGNTLDAVDSWTNQNKPVAIETAWGNPVANQAHFNGLKNLGFKIVRIPVTWVGHIGPAPDYKIEESWLRRVAEVVNMAHNAGLKAFINLHHDGNHNTGGGWLFIDKAGKDASITDKFEKVWRQIAEYFINYGDNLMFQGFNEIHSGDWGQGNAAQYKIINDWNQRFTNVVRSTGGNNAQRYLLYYGYNTHYTIGNSSSPFRLPNDSASNRQIVGFHFYYPYDFALEAKNHIWPSGAERASNQSSKAFIDSVFGSFKTKFIDKGIPVIIGESGPFRYINYKGNDKWRAGNVDAAKQNRLVYTNYLYTKARENGLVLFFWENGTLDNPHAVEGDASLIDRNNGQPNIPENAIIIQTMMDAVNNTTPPAPLR